MKCLLRKPIVVGGILSIGLAVLGVRPIHAQADSVSVIHACYKKITGALRIVGGADDCSPSETAVEWNLSGPPGPQGPAGPQGVQGPQGPVGPSDAFAAIQTDLHEDVSVAEPILSLSLPAGSYVLNATITAFDKSTFGTNAACDVEGSTGGIDFQPVGPNVRLSTPSFFIGAGGTLAITTAFTLGSPDTVSLWCRNLFDHGIYRWGTITAVRTGTVTLQP